MDEKTAGVELYLNPQFVYDKHKDEYVALEDVNDY